MTQEGLKDVLVELESEYIEMLDMPSNPDATIEEFEEDSDTGRTPQGTMEANTVMPDGYMRDLNKIKILETPDQANVGSIVKKAVEDKITILNLKDPEAFLKQKQEELQKKKEEKQKKLEEKSKKQKEKEKKAKEAKKEDLAEKLTEEEKKDEEKKEKDKVLITKEK